MLELAATRIREFLTAAAMAIALVSYWFLYRLVERGHIRVERRRIFSAPRGAKTRVENWGSRRGAAQPGRLRLRSGNLTPALGRAGVSLAAVRALTAGSRNH